MQSALGPYLDPHLFFEERTKMSRFIEVHSHTSVSKQRIIVFCHCHRCYCYWLYPFSLKHESLFPVCYRKILADGLLYVSITIVSRRCVLLLAAFNVTELK